jgi:hypothetical protein
VEIDCWDGEPAEANKLGGSKQMVEPVVLHGTQLCRFAIS